MNLISITIFISIFCLVPSGAVKYRLSTSVKPSFYAIKLHPDLDKEVFNGTVLIHVRVQDFVESIDLHSCDLTINKILLNTEKVKYLDSQFIRNNETIHAYRFSDYELLEIVRVDGGKISPGSYSIYIDFSGPFSKNDTGFFKARLTQNDVVVSYLAVTDFEPTHARRTFPCFDEPSFKAKFQLNLVTPNRSYIALSNMPAIKSFQTSYGLVYKFETSKRMSPYLLAFAITQYSFGEIISNGLPIRAFSYKAHTDKVNKKAIQYAHQALQFYSEYTGFQYPLPKIDLIEYDRNESTATENWGLITLDSGILSNDTEAGYDDGQRVAIITHELAHFWFGNLVTNEWWDDIWLQEGFAVYMALKAEESILNNNAIKKFSLQYLEDAVYWFDEQKSSKPIVNFVETPSAIRRNFNDITYTKGAAVLQMLERVIGPSSFQDAIIKYICRYAYKTVSTSDFVDIIEKYKPPNSDIRGFMESYLYQNRYPVIKVTETNDFYILKQRSCNYQKDDPESSYEYKWTIPVTFITNIKQSCDQVHWFDRDMEILKIRKENETWIKFNYEQQGLYRVHYSEELWNKIINHSHEIKIDERNHLLLEAVQLYNANIIPCDFALRFLKHFSMKGELPAKTDTLFIAFLKLEKLGRLDQEAHILLTNFFNKIYENDPDTDHKREVYSLLHENDEPEIKKGSELENNVKLCIKWIKKNLRL